jgi:hypothetical protein
VPTRSFACLFVSLLYKTSSRQLVVGGPPSGRYGKSGGGRASPRADAGTFGTEPELDELAATPRAEAQFTAACQGPEQGCDSAS